MNEETIDERNSMQPPFKKYDFQKEFEAQAGGDIEEWRKRNESLQARHKQERIDIWEGIAEESRM